MKEEPEIIGIKDYNIEITNDFSWWDKIKAKLGCLFGFHYVSENEVEKHQRAQCFWCNNWISFK